MYPISTVSRILIFYHQYRSHTTFCFIGFKGTQVFFVFLVKCQRRKSEKNTSVSPLLTFINVKCHSTIFFCVEKTLQVSNNFYCKEKCFILIGIRNLCQLYLLNRYTIFFSKDDRKFLCGILPFKELFLNY